jgi:hypothetical protein
MTDEQWPDVMGTETSVDIDAFLASEQERPAITCAIGLQ